MVNLKAKLAKILAINGQPLNLNYWHVCDQVIKGKPTDESGVVFNELVMVHSAYHDDHPCDLNRAETCLRGEIIDLETEQVLVSSLGPAPMVVTDQLDLVKTDKCHYFQWQETNGANLKIPYWTQPVEGPQTGLVAHCLEPQVRFRPAYEGTLLRVFRHQGTVYHATHKKFDAQQSRWATTSFLDMYHKLNGPSNEQLFPDDQDYCYYFLLVHPEVQLSSSADIGQGFIICLGVRLADREVTVSHLEPLYQSGQLRPNQYLNLEEAQTFLQQGWVGQPEAVMAEYREPGGNPLVLKIVSTDYYRRLLLRGNCPNLYYRTITLTDPKEQQSLTKAGFKWQTYPSLALEKIRELSSANQLASVASPFSPSKKRKSLPFYQVWLNLLANVATAKREEMLAFLNQFQLDRDLVIHYILTDHHRNDKAGLTSSHLAQQWLQIKKVEPHKPDRQIIKRLVYDLQGQQLYDLIREAKRYNKLH